ncbi:adapter molecule Crk-like isoform X2 [Physella acuta]|uniref:adapter molecule Crk-like isoform X2 n=1 Tax=Physella acuta TaxID=109671 RepID=UPI0027DBE839|nr:adapter molecule Crk-like isoform X2 [Physella acuta]
MEADFDPEDKYSWYFGMLSRERTNNILLGQEHSGVFLVRESRTMPGDFVLCVKEDQKVSHYIINRIQASGNSRFKIGDKEFPDIPSLLNFYKTHYLDTTTLIKPAPRARLLCKYDFPGKDPEDLPFKRGDILEVISEDEEEWWTARNTNGQVGQIPVRYTQPIEQSQQTNTTAPRPQQQEYQQPDVRPSPIHDIQLPAKAQVILQRIPSAYDRRQLRLEVGDIVTVLKMNLNGQWEGISNGKEGIFPFTHIRFLTPEELRNLNT